MLYIRHKIMLSLISKLPNVSSKFELLHWLFLIKHETLLKERSKFYDFLPSVDGPYSYLASYDYEKLSNDGHIALNSPDLNKHVFLRFKASISSLDEALKRSIDSVVYCYRNHSVSDLAGEIGERYPHYSCKSGRNTRTPVFDRPVKTVYTVGYEGKTIDSFFDNLLSEGIRRIIDVRSNPISRKFGFSKKAMCRISENVGMDYVHFPEIGISSTDRRRFDSQPDNRELLKYYGSSILHGLSSEKKQIAKSSMEMPSALICFESEPSDCHRGVLAGVLSDEYGLQSAHL